MSWPMQPSSVNTGAAVAVANNVYIERFSVPVTMKLGATANISVTTLFSGGHVDVGVYDSGGTLRWHTGGVSTTSAAVVQTTGITAYTLQPGVVYYLASCADNTTSITANVVAVGSSSNAGSVLLGGGTANTFGTDSTAGDKCTSGVLAASITTTNIANSTTNMQIPAVEVLN